MNQYEAMKQAEAAGMLSMQNPWVSLDDTSTRQESVLLMPNGFILMKPMSKEELDQMCGKLEIPPPRPEPFAKRTSSYMLIWPMVALACGIIGALLGRMAA